MSRKLKIALIGNGNASRFFHAALSDAGHQVVVFARNNDQTEDIELINDRLKEFQVVLLCVTDSSITEVSDNISSSDTLIAHVSGAMPLEVISSHHNHQGVFYPLMSLSSQETIIPSTIPFCIEANSNASIELLRELATSLGAQSNLVDSKARAYLHVAAVFANNFSNHIYYIASKILASQDLDFKMMIPMLENSLQKMKNESPLSLQTGPAVRGDEKTIKTHLELIENPIDAEIYKLLTNSIKKTHE